MNSQQAARPITDTSEYWAAQFDVVQSVAQTVVANDNAAEMTEEVRVQYIAREALAASIMEKVRGYREWAQQTGRAATWRRALSLFFGWDVDKPGTYSSRLTLQGKQGELVVGRANLFRAYVRSILNTVTGSRPAFECRAIADDSTATEAIRLGNAVVDYYQTRGGAEKANVETATLGILLSEGYTGVFWDETAGTPLSLGDAAQSAKDGDISFTSVAPWDIARDPCDQRDLLDWIVVRRPRNKWAFARRYPKHAECILNAPPAARFAGVFDEQKSRVSTPAAEKFPDQVDIWEFYHRPTGIEGDPLRDGLIAYVVNDKIVAIGPNVYESLPLIRMAPVREYGTGAYYAESWDLMALQQAIDNVVTQLLTNQENFGLVNLFVKTGTNFNEEMLSGGLRILYGDEAPVPMQWNAGAAAETVGVAQFLQSLAQVISGQNDVAMGDASKSQSGQALAMMSQLAIMATSGSQREYAFLNEGVGTAILDRLRRFARAERVIEITGRGQATIVKRFMGEELSVLRGVTVDLGSPALRSAAGRQELAQMLFSANAINVEQLFEIMSTGRAEPAFDGPQTSRSLIQRENDRLASGQVVKVSPTDVHAEHIRGHSTLLNDPDLRDDPTAYAAVVAHIQEHDQTWLAMSTDPMGMGILVSTGSGPVGQGPHPGAALIAPPAAGAPTPAAPPGPPPAAPDMGATPPMPANTNSPPPTPGDLPAAPPGATATSNLPPLPDVPPGQIPVA